MGRDSLDGAALPPLVIWLTGLPGAGKTTLARKCCALLSNANVNVTNLDGDEIRRLFPKTGFSKEERENHNLRVAYMARHYVRHGTVAIVSLISPFIQTRAKARELCQPFVEVHVATPLSVCQKRDPKGLYAKAREGVIQNMTGVQDIYEAPPHPEIRIDTTNQSVESCSQKLVQYVYDTYESKKIASV